MDALTRRSMEGERGFSPGPREMLPRAELAAKGMDVVVGPSLGRFLMSYIFLGPSSARLPLLQQLSESQ